MAPRAGSPAAEREARHPLAYDGFILWSRSPLVADEQSAGIRHWHQPLLIVNPLDDAAFVEAAHDRVKGCDLSGQLEARLRADYPSVAVHPRELSGESRRVWYVYRDGHWVPSRGRG